MAILRYTRVSREALLSAKEKVNVNLFFRRASGEDEEYVLFARAGMGRVALEKLEKNPVGSLYVREDELHKYRDFVERNLSLIVNDERIPLVDKAQVVYNCTVDVMRDMFDKPDSGRNFRRVSEIVQSTVNFALSKPLAVRSLLGIGAKDYYTFSHCVQASVLSIGVAKLFGIVKIEDLYELGLGTILLDIGKTKIDKRILNKPGKLTEEEFGLIKMHPVYGYEMCKGILPERSLDIILHHHEKSDGTGYPDGIRYDHMTLFAKIAAVADVYDALTTERVYARATGPFEAVKIMKYEMAGHFAGDPFEKFINMLGPSGGS